MGATPLSFPDLVRDATFEQQSQHMAACGMLLLKATGMARVPWRQWPAGLLTLLDTQSHAGLDDMSAVASVAPDCTHENLSFSQLALWDIAKDKWTSMPLISDLISQQEAACNGSSQYLRRLDLALLAQVRAALQFDPAQRPSVNAWLASFTEDMIRPDTTQLWD